MDTTPRYVFLGFVCLIGASLAAIYIYSEKTKVPEPGLHGAGSTFINPLMVQWSHFYEQTDTGCRIAYLSSGSGTGIKHISDNRVDFACSDAPMTDAQIDKAVGAGGTLLHIPLIMGAVVPVYHLAEVKQQLKFTGPVLADIYLGKVKRWNDERLQKLNPGVQLPDKEIVVVHRSDGSGTTYIWVDYLSKVSPEWKKQVGVGTSVNWPVGTSFVGNDGVSQKVQKTPHTIGYVELTTAHRLDLAFGLVQNRAGEFVKASLPAVTTAAANALTDIPDDLRYSLTDAPGKGSYPIAERPGPSSGPTNLPKRDRNWAISSPGQPRKAKTRLGACSTPDSPNR